MSESLSIVLDTCSVFNKRLLLLSLNLIKWNGMELIFWGNKYHKEDCPRTML